MGAREEGYPSISIRTPTDKLGSDLRKRNEIRSRILMFWWMHKILSQIESILKHLNIPKYILLVQDPARCTLLVLDCREMCKTNITSTRKIGAPFKRALLVCGHCSWSFWPPTPLCQTGTVLHFLALFISLVAMTMDTGTECGLHSCSNEYMDQITIQSKKNCPYLDVDKKVPQTIWASVYSPHPRQTGNARLNRPLFKKGFSLTVNTFAMLKNQMTAIFRY